jgi:uncharacterized membrane protein
MGLPFWSLTGLLTAVAVHLAYVLFAPGFLFATQSRLAAATDSANAIDILTDERRGQLLPTLRGDGIAVVCNADLAKGDVRFEVQLPETYWSLAVFSRSGKQVYQLNDAQAETTSVALEMRYAKSIFERILGASDEDEAVVIQDAAWTVDLSERQAFAVFWVPLTDPLLREPTMATLKKGRCSLKQTA